MYKQRDQVEKIELRDSEQNSEVKVDMQEFQNKLQIRHMQGKNKAKDMIIPAIYNISNPQPLQGYLKDFEYYFAAKYNGEWECFIELGRFLEGEIKEIFEKVGGPRKDYSTVKEKLVTWYKSLKISGVEHWRKVLKEIVIRSGESLLQLGLQVEEAASHAYSKNLMDWARKMRSFYLKSIPCKFRDRLQEYENMKMLMKGVKKLN